MAMSGKASSTNVESEFAKSPTQIQALILNLPSFAAETPRLADRCHGSGTEKQLDTYRNRGESGWAGPCPRKIALTPSLAIAKGR